MQYFLLDPASKTWLFVNCFVGNSLPSAFSSQIYRYFLIWWGWRSEHLLSLSHLFDKTHNINTLWTNRLWTKWQTSSSDFHGTFGAGKCLADQWQSAYLSALGRKKKTVMWVFSCQFLHPSQPPCPPLQPLTPQEIGN